MMKDHFYGWYFRCTDGENAIAVIPSVHFSEGKRFGSVQIIEKDRSFSAAFDESDIGDRGMIEIGKSRFDEDGMTVDIGTPALKAKGVIVFGEVLPLKYDIMGPFKFIPFMECKHAVVSMRHRVTGEIAVNGRIYTFSDSDGYIEGDRGCSFPKRYLWTQCFFDSGSLMLSCADIPLCGVNFTGIIAAVTAGGKEYRLATYLGARAEKISGGEAVITQGSLRLTAKLLSHSPHPLNAPILGAMTRTIHENLSCMAYYKLEKGGRIITEFESSDAAFEYEYPN